MQPIPGTARSIRVSLPLSLCYRGHCLGQIVEETCSMISSRLCVKSDSSKQFKFR